MGPADATRKLQAAGFKLGDINYVYSTTVPTGVVAATDPPAGTRARDGSKVNMSVNGGIGAEVKVPSVTGMPTDVAQSKIASIGLTPVAVESYSETIAVGVVMAQVPAPASTLAQGDVVLIQVSKGKEPQKVAVPDVVGKSKDSAVGAIEDAHLAAQVSSVYSDTVAKGKVISQWPDPGTKLTTGSEVSIAVSLGKGVGAVAVPKVVGKTEAEAVDAVNGAGLIARVFRQNSDTVAKGKVIEQVPEGGATTASGAEVAIIVSLGKSSGSGNVSVPNVVGKTEADATSALEDLGFVVQVVSQTSQEPEGNVTQQLPVSGSTAPSGSQVAIAVSKGP
jgi:beta-lactam-binding protein with PASTA domain